MGTRALIVVQDYDGTEIAVIYRQYDGYTTGLGDNLAGFFKDFSIVNGYSGKYDPEANGMGCLAAQLVAHLKEGAGGVYLYPSGTRDCGEQYTYFITCDNPDESPEDHAPVKMRCNSGYYGQMFDGLAKDFDGAAVEEAACPIEEDEDE